MCIFIRFLEVGRGLSSILSRLRYKFGAARGLGNRKDEYMLTSVMLPLLGVPTRQESSGARRFGTLCQKNTLIWTHIKYPGQLFNGPTSDE